MLIARLDNLGKGASGAAIQSMNIHFGLDEGLGLEAPVAAHAQRG
jgi:N-acetyl-gamma-glutamyl-phosphate reductase